MTERNIGISTADRVTASEGLAHLDFVEKWQRLLELIGSVITADSVTTFTNKTISADDNTISGIAASSFVLSDASGEIDGSAAQKAIPAGVVVGTTDTQTLTGKTISADNNTISGIAASSFVLSNGSGNVDGSASQKAIPSGTVVGTSDTQTLTNKRVTERVVAAGATSGTITPNANTTDVFNAAGLTGGVTIGSPSGTPTDGQVMVLRFKDNGTGRSIAWNAIFRAVGVTLPTTTVASKMLYVVCQYHSGDTKWDALNVRLQA